ncbi:MAG: signal peptidase I [Acidobacteriota bacterium]|jgi:signal peptidase I|nr:signal peptidase I [Acidobacteriota bacterium]
MEKSPLGKWKANRRNRREAARASGGAREYAELIAETLIYVFFVMTFLLQSFVIPTGSMEDTLLIGDHLLVDKVAYSRAVGGSGIFLLPQVAIQRGMIVTFKSPAEMDKEYVKRVIALPGETVAILNKKVFIDGKALEEPYTYFRDPQVQMSYRDNYPPFKVPPGQYFCMGDNRDHSYDSRYWGPVPAEYIIGRPWRIYWSYEARTDDYMAPGIINQVRSILRTVVHFFSRTRWQRSLQLVR